MHRVARSRAGSRAPGVADRQLESDTSDRFVTSVTTPSAHGADRTRSVGEPRPSGPGPVGEPEAPYATIAMDARIAGVVRAGTAQRVRREPGVDGDPELRRRRRRRDLAVAHVEHHE